MTNTKKGPLILCILDGWGETGETRGNPIKKAKLPTIDKLNQYYPKTYLQASGIAVGLPWGVVGNSEVGHQAMGTGQIIYQQLPVINTSIQDGTFFENEVLLKNIKEAKKKKIKIHLFGLVSDGGVHSHIEHLLALLEVMRDQEFNDVYIHVVTDGRDTSPRSAKGFVEDLLEKIKETGVGQIATVSGRYYPMDRSQNWGRIEKAYQAMVQGEGEKAKSALEAIDKQYEKGNTDEFIEPTVIEGADGKPVGKIESGDIFLCFNFRKDRAKQIIKSFLLKDFKEFEKTKIIKGVKPVCFAQYEADFDCDVIFPPQKITSRIGEEIEKSGLKQMRIAETEKFAHVTYFFDGGEMADYKNEEKVHVLSKKVSSYAEVPEMSAEEVTNKILEVLDNPEKMPDFILVNYANPDMVGHTGDLEAGIKAVEFTDGCVKKLIEKIILLRGTLLITADHGNVEEMIDLSTGGIDTEHSNNPVPCWLVTENNHKKNTKEERGEDVQIGGFLSDIAPTVLELLGIKKNSKITGESLVSLFGEKKNSDKD